MLLLTEEAKWGLLYPEVYCSHADRGSAIYDPGRGTKHFDPWWMLVACDRGVIDLYCWFLRRHGKPTMPNRLWGPHVSIVKHEEPPEKGSWGVPREVEFRYTNNVRWDNQCHAWLDVYSPESSEIRQSMGLPAKEWFHLTLGRLT